MASRGAGAAVVDRFKAELHERVVETLNFLCGAFTEELEVVAQPPAPLSAGQVDYDTYNDCCQRLVQYIAANMDTLPYFTQQMDRIIMACHSNTSEQVLSSLVTKDVWLRPREKENSRVENQEEIQVSTSGERGENVRQLSVKDATGDLETGIKTESAQVSSTPASETLSLRAEDKTRRRSVSSTRQVLDLPSTPSASRITDRKRRLGRRTAPPAKRQRQEEDQNVIELLSTADEGGSGDSDSDRESDSDLFDLRVDTDTETEEETDGYGTNDKVEMEYSDDEEDEDCRE